MGYKFKLDSVTCKDVEICPTEFRVLYRRIVDGKERGLDTMHLYITSRLSLSRQ